VAEQSCDTLIGSGPPSPTRRPCRRGPRDTTEHMHACAHHQHTVVWQTMEELWTQVVGNHCLGKTHTQLSAPDCVNTSAPGCDAQVACHAQCRPFAGSGTVQCKLSLQAPSQAAGLVESKHTTASRSDHVTQANMQTHSLPAAGLAVPNSGASTRTPSSANATTQIQSWHDDCTITIMLSHTVSHSLPRNQSHTRHHHNPQTWSPRGAARPSGAP
jgi:hypothetical protein